MERTAPRDDRFYLPILVIIFLVLHLALLRPILTKYDPVGYYSWLRSAVIDGDLNVRDEFHQFDISRLIKDLGGVYPAQPWPIGSALVWTPFFLLAHLATLAANAGGLPWPADGYSLVYRLLVSLGTTCYTFLALWLLYGLLREYFDPRRSFWALVSVWLASPLVFYMYCHPMWVHALDMFGYTLVLVAWRRARAAPRPYGAYILLGAAAGLAALIRTQNVVLVFIIGAFLLYDVIRGRVGLQSGVLLLALFSAAWWLTFSPQLYVWRLTYGTWIPGFVHTQVGGGEFYAGFPFVLDVLFASNRGLFFWHPLLLFGVVGLWFFRKTDGALTCFFLASLLLQLAIVGSWDGWSGGHAFGQRFLVNLSPAYMFGLAALFQVLARRLPWGWLAGVCAFFIVWNFVLIVQYAVGTVPRGGPVAWQDLVTNQFLIIPRHFRRVLEAWLKRS